MTKIWLSNTPPPRQNNRLKSITYSELGRSMVEMLGVLAVMGLLTIIGIAGFKIAMNKAKANNLVADMNRLAHIVVMDKFSGYSEEAIQNAVTEHNQNTEYQAEYEYRTPQVFAIKTKNPIDKEMCQQVANLGWKLPLATYLNKVKIEGTFDENKCTDENELIWAFTNDFSACPDCALGDFDCTPYANRECGTCDSIGYTPNNADCANNANGQYCVNGKCRACDTNQFWNTSSNSCQECIDSHNNAEYHTTAEYINACLGIMASSNCCGADRLLGCHSTYYDLGGKTDPTSCGACPNRCYNPDDQKCYLAGENRIYSRKSVEDATCQCNYVENSICKCPTNYFWYTDSRECRECFDDTVFRGWGTSSEYFHACLGTMVKDSLNRLLGCHISMEPIAGSEPTSCGACPNRCYEPSTQSCYLAGEGQAHQRVSDTDGTCAN